MRAGHAFTISLEMLGEELAEGAHEDAILAYQRALARDPKFSEARYNLAQALEAAGKRCLPDRQARDPAAR